MAKKEISRPQTAHIPPFGLRLQPDLKNRIEEAARAAGRSVNAEIAGRLQQSLESPDLTLLKAQLLQAQMEASILRLSLDEAEAAGTLSDESRRRVRLKADIWGCSIADALERVVIAGTSEGAAAVVVIEANPGTTMEDYRRVFAASAAYLPANTEAVVRTKKSQESEEQKATRRKRKYIRPD